MARVRNRRRGKEGEPGKGKTEANTKAKLKSMSELNDKPSPTPATSSGSGRRETGNRRTQPKCTTERKGAFALPLRFICADALDRTDRQVSSIATDFYFFVHSIRIILYSLPLLGSAPNISNTLVFGPVRVSTSRMTAGFLVMGQV